MHYGLIIGIRDTFGRSCPTSTRLHTMREIGRLRRHVVSHARCQRTCKQSSMQPFSRSWRWVFLRSYLIHENCLRLRILGGVATVVASWDFYHERRRPFRPTCHYCARLRLLPFFAIA